MVRDGGCASSGSTNNNVVAVVPEVIEAATGATSLLTDMVLSATE